MIRVYLHGFGSSATHFRSQWIQAGYQIGSHDIFVDGLEAEPLSSRRRWFPLTGLDAQLGRFIDASIARVEETIRRLLPSTPHSGSGVCLVGHSQGGMLALAMALRAQLTVTRAEIYAAFLPRIGTPQVSPGAAEVEFLLHSSRADRYIGENRVKDTMGTLRESGAQRIRCRVASALPHDFSPDWLDAGNFWEC